MHHSYTEVQCISALQCQHLVHDFLAEGDACVESMARFDIPDATFLMITRENLVPNLERIHGWGVPSVWPVADFLNNRWSRTAPGRFAEIHNSTLCINEWYIDNDPKGMKAGIEHVVLSAKAQGRSVHFTGFRGKEFV